MIKKLRYKLSEFLFNLGKLIHPDIAELKAKITKLQEEIAKENLIIRGWREE